MFKQNVEELPNGSKQTTFRMFGFPIYCSLTKGGSGWFRIFGIGLTWKHDTIQPMFSERIGKRKKIKIGEYRYGFLK